MNAPAAFTLLEGGDSCFILSLHPDSASSGDELYIKSVLAGVGVSLRTYRLYHPYYSDLLEVECYQLIHLIAVVIFAEYLQNVFGMNDLHGI